MAAGVRGGWSHGSAARKQREMGAGAQLAFFFLFIPESQHIVRGSTHIYSGSSHLNCTKADTWHKVTTSL